MTPGGGEAEPRRFDASTVEEDVHCMMVEVYGLQAAKVQDLICPESEPVVRGHGFTCTLRYDGRDLPLTVRVLDDKTAAFEVSAPDLGD